MIQQRCELRLLKHLSSHKLFKYEFFREIIWQERKGKS